MPSTTVKAISAPGFLTITLVLLACPVVAGAQVVAPVKEITSAHFGWEVDQATKGAICTVVSADMCQPGRPSSEPGGFEHSRGVAVNNDRASSHHGDIYVADSDNHRVQELTATGEFVSMFGRDVNETNGGNVCSEQEIKISHVKCKTGIGGQSPGQFGERLQNIAVDPGSGYVYVAELLFNSGIFSYRVQEFTATGEFVLEIGREVNETTKGNLCTQAEAGKGVKCRGPAPTEASTEHGTFEFPSTAALSVGGPQDLLYVGDARRVQEFEANGEYKGEIPLAASSVAVDDSCALHEPEALTENTAPTCKEFDAGYGDLYLAQGNVVRRFDTNNKEIGEFILAARQSSGTVSVKELAVDSIGRLAVAEEVNVSAQKQFRGGLYEIGALDLHLITEFAAPPANGIAFSAGGDMYLTGDAGTGLVGPEVIAYNPVAVGALTTVPPDPATDCQEGTTGSEADATLVCALKGEVDAWGVKETVVWFQWGRTPLLGEYTSLQPIPNEKTKEGQEEIPVKANSALQGLLPNDTLYYRLAGEDHNVKAPELLSGETIEFPIPSAPPRIVGSPSVSYVHSSSAVMFGELNPENARTSYEFQYAPSTQCAVLEGCAAVAQTQTQESSAYGTVAATLEATGLGADTAYRYRLVARNQKNEPAVNETGGSPLPEGEFTTAPAPVPRASTGPASAIATTSATISGAVSSDGQPATYTFELGVYAGAATQYGTLLSGQVNTGEAPVEKTLALSGLQPGTQYAYRITIKSGYGAATGAPGTFTTLSVPPLVRPPVVLGQLPIPDIQIPREPVPLTRAQQLARALRACAKRPKSKLAACRRNAHRKYSAGRGR